MNVLSLVSTNSALSVLAELHAPGAPMRKRTSAYGPVPAVAHSTVERSRRWPRATGQRLSVTKESQDLFNSFGN